MDYDDDVEIIDEPSIWRMDGVEQSFEETYHIRPASSLSLGNLRNSVEFGGKLLMPPSALEKLSRMEISYPMMFEVVNDANGKCSNAGVLEFSSSEGIIYAPDWMVATIGAKSNGLVRVRNVTLRLGKYVKIQPQSVDFLDITDPKAVLEHSLRQFSALTVGDKIAISYNNRIYHILVLETKPDPKSISIVETDLQVDFATPLGYVEPEPKEKSLANSLSSSIKSFTPIGGPFSGTALNSKGTKIEPNTTDNSVPKALKLPPNTVFFGGQVKKEQKPPQNDPFFQGTPNKLK